MCPTCSGLRRAPADPHLGAFEGDGLTLLVNSAVVAPAQEDEVVQARGPAVYPVLDVVAIAPPLRTITPWIATATVPDHQRSTQCGRNRAGAAANIERLRGASRDDPGDPGITGQPERGSGSHDAGAIDFTGCPGSVFENGQVHGEADVGALSSAGREPAMVEVISTDLYEGIGSKLGRRSLF
jgi:hypothetical protein